MRNFMRHQFSYFLAIIFWMWSFFKGWCCAAWWCAVLWLRCRLGHPLWFDHHFADYQGYRQGRGFRWEQWVFNFHGKFPMWLQFENGEHEPPPLTVGSPLKVEDYTAGR